MAGCFVFFPFTFLNVIPKPLMQSQPVVPAICRKNCRAVRITLTRSCAVAFAIFPPPFNANYTKETNNYEYREYECLGANETNGNEYHE
jgi:hypothetical protein